MQSNKVSAWPRCGYNLHNVYLLTSSIKLMISCRYREDMMKASQQLHSDSSLGSVIGVWSMQSVQQTFVGAVVQVCDNTSPKRTPITPQKNACFVRIKKKLNRFDAFLSRFCLRPTYFYPQMGSDIEKNRKKLPKNSKIWILTFPQNFSPDR